jgi:hypothetical protein
VRRCGSPAHTGAHGLPSGLHPLSPRRSVATAVVVGSAPHHSPESHARQQQWAALCVHLPCALKGCPPRAWAHGRVGAMSAARLGGGGACGAPTVSPVSLPTAHRAKGDAWHHEA